ncbi:hypothetical protein DFP90_102211 [Aestuariispira insulae]|uniref:Uncharacterized protein n=1 Tax=Aestuariispira insulae TaxID=1461337 RepID=A0A3D9HRQ4_9PROT|nr:hypothetical protein DFP90_102211 [Aestuariispira insulae]
MTENQMDKTDPTDEAGFDFHAIITVYRHRKLSPFRRDG